MSTRLQDDRIRLGLLVSLILLTTACGREVPAYCEDADPVSEEASAPFLLPETEEAVKSLEEIEGIWRSGPHGDMNVQAASNYAPTCNRCHDRLNWAPAKTGLGTQDLSNSDGKSARLIGNTTDGCRICHPEPGESSPETLAWLEDAQNTTYAEVLEPGDLCLQCHQGSDADGHNDVILNGAHVDLDCTDCHDAHSSEATCTGAGCHPAFTQECEVINTHDKPHQEVSCSGCHDSAGYPIGWNEETAAWDTFRASAGSGGEAVPYTSHELLTEVDCDRCHAPGNHPWGY